MDEMGRSGWEHRLTAFVQSSYEPLAQSFQLRRVRMSKDHIDVVALQFSATVTVP